jgi:hypothetical protein
LANYCRAGIKSLRGTTIQYLFSISSLKSYVYLLRVRPPFKIYNKSAAYGHLGVQISFLHS